MSESYLLDRRIHQTQSIQAWVHHYHFDMNSFNTKSWTLSGELWNWSPARIHRISREVARLQRMILQAPSLPCDIIVYKGTKTESISGMTLMDIDRRLLIWNTFVATSLSKSTARSFNSEKLLNIVIPRRSRVLFYADKGENEVLLPAFSVFFVIDETHLIFLGVQKRHEHLKIWSESEVKQKRNEL